jgi:calcineurin-like phosphoesterase family protein
MSYNIFFASDYHFRHSKPYNTFKRPDGRFLRYEFANAEECDEAMIERHNAVVKDNDRIYMVGDIAFHKRDLPLLGRMKGRKVLIKGNHDTCDLKDYLPYFDDIRGVHQFAGMVITHIPIHPDSLARWGMNVHGHLHANRVMYKKEHTPKNVGCYYYTNEIDPRYFNVSVEQINYTPISLEEIKKHGKL